jgi:hypothetical protein
MGVPDPQDLLSAGAGTPLRGHEPTRIELEAGAPAALDVAQLEGLAHPPAPPQEQTASLVGIASRGQRAQLAQGGRGDQEMSFWISW